MQQDDEVVVVGRQGEAEIHAEEVAQLAGTINYDWNPSEHRRGGTLRVVLPAGA